MKTVLKANPSSNVVVKDGLIQVFKKLIMMKRKSLQVIEKSNCANASVCNGLCSYGQANTCYYYVVAGNYKNY